MYHDPKCKRDRRLTLRFDDYEHNLIQALANYQGEQPASLLRQMVLREAAALASQMNDEMVSQSLVD
ncbi:hypothetical protein [Undibacterium umbellatum]|uniref:CopG family transcriptional regulator n=1 Tax=Undibacterium umbellatum TaxID=2762300 RepID=A0ABR6ZIS0_9BURK|nr:hypothetical protein [Undibacterium umbellatum]MBC3911578.1 hypothetical protein [Undibacterium umbellatum]